MKLVSSGLSVKGSLPGRGFSKRSFLPQADIKASRAISIGLSGLMFIVHSHALAQANDDSHGRRAIWRSRELDVIEATTNTSVADELACKA
jgi:hypothetical protein